MHEFCHILVDLLSIKVMSRINDIYFPIYHGMLSIRTGWKMVERPSVGVVQRINAIFLAICSGVSPNEIGGKVVYLLSIKVIPTDQ